MSEPAGSVMNYIVLDQELLGMDELTLTEKVILAYLEASEECEKEVRTVDYCARYLDLSESDFLFLNSTLSRS